MRNWGVRKGILFASMPGLLAVGVFVPVRSAADVTAAASRNELSIQPRQGGCGLSALSSPGLGDVHCALTKEVAALTEGAATTEVVREALLETYGSRVTETATPMHYVKVWDPYLEQWVWVCLSASEFAIDFGDDGTIVVASRDLLLMEK